MIITKQKPLNINALPHSVLVIASIIGSAHKSAGLSAAATLILSLDSIFDVASGYCILYSVYWNFVVDFVVSYKVEVVVD